MTSHALAGLCKAFAGVDGAGKMQVVEDGNAAYIRWQFRDHELRISSKYAYALHGHTVPSDRSTHGFVARLAQINPVVLEETGHTSKNAALDAAWDLMRDRGCKPEWLCGGALMSVTFADTVVCIVSPVVVFRHTRMY